MIDSTSLSDAIDHILEEEGRVSAQVVPGVFQLSADDEPLNETYYVRHRVETVRRIWATADTDARALVAMLGEDYDAARIWADYLSTEMNHDKLYLADLLHHGVDAEQARATPPLQSTVAMVETLVRDIDTYGSLPAVAYSLFVEWNSARAAAGAVDRARTAFGPEFVKGAAAHVGVDKREDHASQMLEVAHRLVSRRSDGPSLLFALLRKTSAFFRAYFTELHAVAVEATRAQAAQPAHGQSQEVQGVAQRASGLGAG